MNTRIVSHSTVMLATLALFAGAALAQAQDNSKQSSDQQTTAHRQSTSQQQTKQPQPGAQAQAQSRPETTRPEARSGPQTANRNSTETQRSRTETAHARAENHAPRRVASADQGTVIARYRREHPHAAARCHDGFFTTTTDRSLACSKHGGIEIWLLP